MVRTLTSPPRCPHSDIAPSRAAHCATPPSRCSAPCGATGRTPSSSSTSPTAAMRHGTPATSMTSRCSTSPGSTSVPSVDCCQCQCTIQHRERERAPPPCARVRPLKDIMLQLPHFRHSRLSAAATAAAVTAILTLTSCRSISTAACPATSFRRPHRYWTKHRISAAEVQAGLAEASAGEFGFRSGQPTPIDTESA